MKPTIKSIINTALIVAVSTIALASVAHADTRDSKDADLKYAKSGANFITGGIGREEVEAMRRLSKQYALQILLSQGTHGTALTDVAVTITDSSGIVVFKIQHAGPLLYVKLQPGEYKVSGNYNGLKQAEKITLGAESKGQKLYLVWPGQSADEIPEE